MKTFKISVVLVALIAMNVTLNSSARTIKRIIHDEWIIHIADALNGVSIDDARIYYGTNCINNICFGDNIPSMAYSYYMTTSFAGSICVKAVNKTGGRDYVYDVSWDVCLYEFSEHEKPIISKYMMRWLVDNLSKTEVDQLLISIGWRGLYTNSKYPEYAFEDVLQTVSVFYDGDACKIINAYLMRKDVNNSRKSIVLSSLLSKYSEYDNEAKKQISIMVEKFLEETEVDTERMRTILHWYMLNDGISAEEAGSDLSKGSP